MNIEKSNFFNILVLSKYCFVIFLFNLFFFNILEGYANCNNRLRIVDNGRSYSVIVIGNSSSKTIISAAELLSKYVLLSSDVQIEILKSFELTQNTEGIKVWVGRSDYVDKLDLNLLGKDEDDFVISFPDEKNIVIVGSSDWGTEFGVYDFLERFLGVRWLLPGPAGEHVPKHPTVEIPVKEVREEPAFFSRQLSGLRGQAQQTWARRNRMQGRVKFHHNLYRLFPPKIYKKTHPEFFPIRNGKRYLPPSDRTYGWQPCFSAPGIVEESTKNILNYFAEHPEQTSYSLGVNDSGGHCECGKCRAKEIDKKNFLGYSDFSDCYFEWVNAVVEGVLKVYPDKWFGCLAYNEVAQPPTKVAVHPRIIPYMTYDRMKWVDPQIEKEGKTITEMWSLKASRVGWYDYLGGSQYCIPRVYFHKMEDYYRYAHRMGVKAMYAEAYPNWGEGPKLYVALKLQWNPDQDVEALLKEWYTCAVGENAAPYLAAYYDLWETFWTKRIPGSDWFKTKGTFLKFKDPSYLDLVTYEDISKSRKLLELVLAKAQTEKQRARAEVLLRAFEYYEASVVSYMGLVRHIQLPDKKPEYYSEMAKKRYRLVEEFENDAVLIHPSRFDKEKKFRKLRW